MIEVWENIFNLVKVNFYDGLYSGLSAFPFLSEPIIADVINMAHILATFLTLGILFVILWLPIKYLIKLFKKLVRL